MYLLDLTLETPEQNLALEEALLGWAEEHESECLRLWESPRHFVVLGAGSPCRTDVNAVACDLLGVPVLRRCSGGGTVVQGPGCLNYTLVLDRQTRPELESIAGTNQFVLGLIGAAVRRAAQLEGVAIQGISDLTTGPLKFSGNAQRRRRRFVLFHGTVLHGFDLGLISECLGTPEKMPDYREAREHGGFVTNISVDADQLKREIAREWRAEHPMIDWPAEKMRELAAGRYCDQGWIRGI